MVDTEPTADLAPGETGRVGGTGGAGASVLGGPQLAQRDVELEHRPIGGRGIGGFLEHGHLPGSVVAGRRRRKNVVRSGGRARTENRPTGAGTDPVRALQTDWRKGSA
jgi:hypothetical protein